MGRKQTLETRKKISGALRSNRINIVCVSCGEEFFARRKYCSDCNKYRQNKTLFEKLNIIETNLQRAGQLAKDKLVELYYVKKLSTLDIYRKYGIKENTIFWYLKKHNIPLRTHSESVLKLHVEGKLTLPSNHMYKSGYHKTWFGKEVFLRSSYEFKFADHLDRLKVYYEVEDKRFQYRYKNVLHTYIPDFYIPDWNLIVETKSGYFNDRDKNIIKKKRQSVQDSGLEFLLLLDDEIDEYIILDV